MKARKKLLGTKQKIREEKSRERKTAVTITAAILVAVLSVAGFCVISILNKPSPAKQTDLLSQLRAAIVDQESLTFPNQTFAQTAKTILQTAGYIVDYFSGEDVTVDFWRNLPTHDYALMILRVHSTAAELQGKDYVEMPVVFFTSEAYSRDKYLWEQLDDQLGIVSYTMPQQPYYFGLTPKFVTSSMNGMFQNTVVIMMGCEGLNNTKMAEAFVEKGAKAYIGWDGSVTSEHTDEAATRLLQHLVNDNETIRKAVESTMSDVGLDPVYHSQLSCYPQMPD